MNQFAEYHDGAADPNNPSDQRSVDFDWEGLARSLGEGELAPWDFQELALDVSKLLRWLVEGDNLGRAGNEGRNTQIAAKVLALVWTINPAIFEGTPSLRALAARHGISKSALSLQTTRLRTEFSIFNRTSYEGQAPLVPPLPQEELRRN